MSEDTNKENKQNLPDLSQLSEIKFETAWTPVSNAFEPSERRNGNFKPRKFGDKFGKATGKFSDKPRQGDDFRRGDSFKKAPRPDSSERKPFDGNRDRPRNPNFKSKFAKDGKRFEKHIPFIPTMEVLFYPDDTPFNKLIDVMKSSKRTYQLFDIAHLVLEKFDRFVILAKNLPDAEGNTKPLYCAQPMNLPFEDEQEAKKVAVEYYVKNLFNTEEIECEAPKGNFQVVNKCTITGELLGAPNWHRYNEFLREYHARKCQKMSFESFTASIESVRDAEQIEAWLNQMKTRTVYKLKEPKEGEVDTFDTLEAATNYVTHKMGDELVKTYDQVRMKGSNVEFLPRGRIRRNIEDAWSKQKKFPIVTANNLRGRLRRSGLTVYKRGSKGFAFVSAIKRKFLFEGDKLSELPQQIFDFVSQFAGIMVEALPYKLMGIASPEKVEQKKAQSNKQDAEAKTENGENAKEETPTAAQPETVVLTDEQKAQFNSILSELSWLISEGYVVEYADSSLQANPYMPKPKDKSEVSEPSAKTDEPLMSQTAPKVSAQKTASEEKEDDEVCEVQKETEELETSAEESEKPADEIKEDSSEK